MGNTSCSPEYLAHMTSLARDVCPFPNYYPNPLFVNMLSPNSSLHLRKHYMEVQSSLTPKQLEDFTQGLRRTFGKEGKVTLGGVGVVALSLAVLFDMLAKQAKGECLSDSGPIPGLFIKNQIGYYPPHVYKVSEYLRLVPHIANNPTRMREETERYVEQIKLEDQSFAKLGENPTLPLDDTTAFNVVTGQLFWSHLNLHLLRIKNGTADVIEGIKAAGNRGDPLWNFNCNLETFNKNILAALQKSDNDTQEAFKICTDGVGTDEPWLKHFVLLDMLNILTLISPSKDISANSIIAQREDFDLKANTLGKWDK